MEKDGADDKKNEARERISPAVPGDESPERERPSDTGYDQEGKPDIGFYAMIPKWWNAFWQLPSMDRATWIIAFATVAYCIVAGFQWKASRDSIEASTRAWVITGEEITMECPEVGKSPAIAYYLVNSGIRPAVNVLSQTSGAFIEGGPEAIFPPDPPYEDAVEIARRNQPSRSVIGAGQRSHDKVRVKMLSADTVAGLLNKTTSLFIYGKIEYEDGFGKTRHTHWCRRWQPLQGCREYRFDFCGSYNDAD